LISNGEPWDWSGDGQSVVLHRIEEGRLRDPLSEEDGFLVVGIAMERFILTYKHRY
jgi:hypothetical protein